MNGFSQPSEDLIKKQDRFIQLMDIHKVPLVVKEEFVASLMRLRSRLLSNVYSLNNTSEDPLRSAFFHITNHQKQALLFHDFYQGLKEVTYKKLEGIALSQRKMKKDNPLMWYARSMDSWMNDITLLTKSDDENGVFGSILHLIKDYVLLIHTLLATDVANSEMVLNELMEFRKSVLGLSHEQMVFYEKILNSSDPLSVLAKPVEDNHVSFFSNSLVFFIINWIQSEIVSQYGQSDHWRALQNTAKKHFPVKSPTVLKAHMLQHIISKSEQALSPKMKKLASECKDENVK